MWGLGSELTGSVPRTVQPGCEVLVAILISRSSDASTGTIFICLAVVVDISPTHFDLPGDML